MLKVKQFKNRPAFNNNSLKNEYEYLINKKYLEISKKEEEKTNKYLQKCILKNTKNDEMIQISKDIVKDFNKYKNLTYLRAKEVDRIAKEEELEPVFITLTNPSEYHPFLTSKEKDKSKRKFKGLNPNFNFLNLEDAIDESYDSVNNIFRELYKNIKVRENKRMKFIKVVEPHASLICHLHRILYINKDTYLKVKKQFNNIKKKHNLQECEIEKMKEAKGSSYIIKYLLKNYNTEEIQKFDGYKKNHKIRIFTMSNLPLSSSIFQKLYYSNEKLNKKITEQIKKGKLKKYNNLFDFYTKNTTIKEVNENHEIIKTFNYENKKRFLVFKQTRKIDKIKTEKIKKYIETITTTRENLKELYKTKKDKDNYKFFKIKEKFKDCVTNEYIYNIDMYYKKEYFYNVERKKILNFAIYDTKLKKEIYNIKNFVLIKMI